MSCAKTLKELGVEYKPERICEGRYLEPYLEQFEHRRSTVMSLMEIGVRTGQSLLLWREYFPNAKLLGIDILQKCKRCESDRIQVKIGSQEDKAFLAELARSEYDVIIDDGGHTMKQQIRSFKALFPAVRSGGLYVIEDLHTSYWPAFGGEFEGRKTTIVMLKGLIDRMHHKWWWHHERTKNARLPEAPTALDNMLASLHFYDSICFIEKKQSVGSQKRYKRTIQSTVRRIP